MVYFIIFQEYFSFAQTFRLRKSENLTNISVFWRTPELAESSQRLLPKIKGKAGDRLTIPIFCLQPSCMYFLNIPEILDEWRTVSDSILDSFI